MHRLPGFTRSPPGLEWWLWKRLPRITAVGTLLPIAALAAAYLLWPETAPGELDPRFRILVYGLMGLLGFFWTMMLTVAIGCVIVMIMKGPAYGADGLAATSDWA